MTATTAVAMTAATERELLDLIVRPDGQEDLCLAIYRPSTGETRTTALITSVIAPERDERFVHGNVTVTGNYILRGLEVARDEGSGLILLHSHPDGHGWQAMSIADRDTEASYANLARELTGLPLVGMTLAVGDNTWSARHWNLGAGKKVDCIHCTNVRVVGDQFSVSWNDNLAPPPQETNRQIRTVSAWGSQSQANLARRRILVVGAGSVGLDIILRLAASGICNLTIMDFDIVEEHNLDRLIGAEPRDVRLQRPKIHVAHREAVRAATAANAKIETSDLSICEPAGLRLALDHDLIFSCVDRPWPRAVLNSLAYSDLIPVIDGGIAIDPFEDGTMRNATWRSHVIRPQRPCMNCNGQLDPADVIPDKQGLRDDPTYIAQETPSCETEGQNVAPLSVSVAASMLAQYTSFSVAPGGLGDPGPLRYSLSNHCLYRPSKSPQPHCPVEADEAVGDQHTNPADRHERAEQQRQHAASPGVRIRLLRWFDDRLNAVVP